MPASEPRRNFLTTLASTILSLPLLWIGVAYMFPELSKRRTHATKIRLGTVDELFASKNFMIARVGDSDAIVFKKDNGYEALSLQCTHARCRVHYAEESHSFLCPCHGGEFHADGSVAKAPPQKPLDRLTLRLHGDTLFLLDTVL